MEIGFIAYDDLFHHTPVEPNPPLPRSVSEACLTSTTRTCVTGATTIWGDAHAAFDEEFLFAEIDQQDLHFAAIIAVYRSGRVEAGDAVLEGEAGTGRICAS